MEEPSEPSEHTLTQMVEDLMDEAPLSSWDLVHAWSYLAYHLTPTGSCREERAA